MTISNRTLGSRYCRWRVLKEDCTRSISDRVNTENSTTFYDIYKSAKLMI